jgi:hypothetical protein
VKPSAAPSKDPLAPSAFFAPRANFRRVCLLPATFGTCRVSHPLRAFTAPRASRACFIPDPPLGFHPTGPSPFAEPQHLSVPVALLVFAWQHPRPTARRSWQGRTRQGRSPSPCGSGGQAPQAPTRADRASLAPRDLPRRFLAEPFPHTRLDGSGARCRTPDSVRFTFRAFLPAKSPDPSAGC